MGSFATMALIVGVFAVLLIGAFVFLWTRDKSRSDDVADDSARLHTDSTQHDEPTSGR